MCSFSLAYWNIFLFTFSDKKKRKEDSKVPVRNVKERSGEEEKKKEKPKAHAPSHTKFRSIGNAAHTVAWFCSIFEHHIMPTAFCLGLEMDTVNPVPVKKTPAAPQLGDKYNIRPPVLKRPRFVACCVREDVGFYLNNVKRLTQLHSGCVLIHFCYSNGGKVVAGAWAQRALSPHWSPVWFRCNMQ